MSKIAVIGCGMVGSIIAHDLSKKHEVFVVDPNVESFKNLPDQQTVTRILGDLYYPGNNVVRVCDLVINAVPGHLGFKTLKSLIEMKKHVVDISFPIENSLLLNTLAQENKVTVVIDCGVAPGMGNIILGHYVHTLISKIQSYKCMVGGLPVKRDLPFEYKAPYSPTDVIEMYTRPAMIRRNGRNITLPALSEPEDVESPVGTLEAFNTDGLRSLLHSFSDIPNMVEKTLRYPGHRKAMEFLRDCGFFNTNVVSGVVPREIAEKLLFDKWKLDKTEDEFTYMTVEIETSTSIIEYKVYDKRDAAGISSMSRTTGYTCAAVANLVLESKINHFGVIPPEHVTTTNPHNLNLILDYLKERGVVYTITEKSKK